MTSSSAREFGERFIGARPSIDTVQCLTSTLDTFDFVIGTPLRLSSDPRLDFGVIVLGVFEWSGG